MNNTIDDTLNLERDVKIQIDYILSIQSMKHLSKELTEHTQLEYFKYINDEFYYYSHIKNKNLDLKKLKEFLIKKLNIVEDVNYKIDKNIKEISYEIKLCEKEKKEIKNELESMEVEMSKLKVSDNLHEKTQETTSNTPNHNPIIIIPKFKDFNIQNYIKNQLNNPIFIEFKKEKEKKIKDLQNSYMKLEKNLKEGKKMYEEKLKKTEILINSNEVNLILI